MTGFFAELGDKEEKRKKEVKYYTPKLRKKITKFVESGKKIDVEFECKKLEYTLVWHCPCCDTANGLWWKYWRDNGQKGNWFTSDGRKGKLDKLKCYICKREFTFDNLPHQIHLPILGISTAKFVKKKSK